MIYNNNMPTINISKDTIDLIIKIYNSGKTTHQVAKKVGHAQSFVINTLKRNNIERRTIYSYTRKYNVNENFFNIIDNEAKAYFLGLMFADGNNYRSEKYGKGHDYQIMISLQEEDKHILETFRDLMVPNLDLKYKIPKNKNWKNQYRLKFDSKIVSNQLNELGCVPNKSLILNYPTIDDNLQNHFLRGYFDGDGCISFWIKQWKTTTNKNYVCKITSSKMFCEIAAIIILNNTNLRMYFSLSKPESINQITTSILIGGNQQVYRLMSWLYKDATIYLKRKHNKFLELEKLIKI